MGLCPTRNERPPAVTPVASDEQAPLLGRNKASDDVGTSDAFDKWCRETMSQTEIPAEEIKILLLGETGGGKSSFLELLRHFPLVCRFAGEYGPADIRRLRELSFEQGRTMASATQIATENPFAIGRLWMNVLDTPGFGDTRGPQIDKEHVQGIVDCVSKHGSLHAIALVVNGRQNRLHPQLKYVLTELGAILPKTMRQNIFVVFTNTAEALSLSFDQKELSELVDSNVGNRVIFIDNPLVTMKRAIHQSDEQPSPTHFSRYSNDLANASANLGKLFVAIANISPVKTDDFLNLYKLRQQIESNTVGCLSKLHLAQQHAKRLREQLQQVQNAENEKELLSATAIQIEGEGFVFFDAPRHGTFCAVRGCHSNCHAPCKMAKVFENSKFKTCCAFRYVRETVDLKTREDRAKLLSHFKERECPFHTDEDGGEGLNYFTVLKARKQFCFQGYQFLKGASVEVSGARTGIGVAARGDVIALQLPARITIRDESEQDRCKVCSHHRKFHYHDAMHWKKMDLSHTVQKSFEYDRAKTFQANRLAAADSITAKIDGWQKSRKNLSEELVSKICQFKDKGLSSNFAMLLQNQRDLLQQHIDATPENATDAGVSALREAASELDKTLDAVRSNLVGLKCINKVEWACVMLGVDKVATLEEVEQARKQQATRYQGNAERGKELEEAETILRRHLEPKGWRIF